MIKLTEKNIDAEIDKLAEKFIDNASKEPQSTQSRFMKLVAFEEPDRLPFFAQIHDHSARVAGITVKEICTDPKKLVYAQLYSGVKYKFDTLMVMADSYNFEAEALGAKMFFPEDSFPVILEPLIKEPGDLDKLEIPDFNEAGRVPQLIEALQLYTDKLGEHAFPAAIACGPWSMAVQVRGFNNLVKDTRKNPEFAHEILDFCVKVIRKFVKVQQKAIKGGMVFPVLGDAFSCIPPTSPKIVYDFVIPHTAKLMKRLGATMWAGAIPVYEIPGWEKLIEDIVIKSKALMGMVVAQESDWIPLEKIKEMSIRLRKPFIFGIRAGIISKSSPAEIENYVKNVIKVLAPGGGCLINGDQIPRDTPPENVVALVSAIKKYGTFPISI